jgi:hypothetical protein
LQLIYPADKLQHKKEERITLFHRARGGYEAGVNGHGDWSLLKNRSFSANTVKACRILVLVRVVIGILVESCGFVVPRAYSFEPQNGQCMISAGN